MKRLTVVALAALLAGCGWDMDAGVWKRAESMCKDRGGVLAASHRKVIASVEVRCGDGQQLYGRLY